MQGQDEKRQQPIPFGSLAEEFVVTGTGKNHALERL